MRLRKILATAMTERRSASIPRTTKNGTADGRRAISRSLSASRSRQTWSIIGWPGAAQESTRKGEDCASRFSVRSQTSWTPGDEFPHALDRLSNELDRTLRDIDEALEALGPND